jgi:phosphopentomutase
MCAKINRVFLIVMDSFGMGELPDADQYGDKGSDTLRSVALSPLFCAPVLTSLGLFNIEGVSRLLAHRAVQAPLGAYARLAERSSGKDTTVGHWEIAGVVSDKSMPVFPDGFPKTIIEAFEEKTGRQVLCNKPYSGTQVLLDYGRMQAETGGLIVYTSADSVFQVAAHEQQIGLDELYRCCEIARGLLSGEYAVGRVIARPYVGEYPDYQRTRNRHDYALQPPSETMLDMLKGAGHEVIGVGKISDIFAGRGISKSVKTANNADGMRQTISLAGDNFSGLCFVNLVDFDMVYGHRNDVEGYARAVSEFDKQLEELLVHLKADDILMITADHGCDPGSESTDHSREYVPLLVYGDHIRHGVDLGTRKSFSDIAATICEIFGVDGPGQSFWHDVKA